MNIEESLWIEKYRPREIKDVVIPDAYKEKIHDYVKKREIPNLLFYGSPGGGKSTVARILASKHGVLQNKDNLLEANGSAKSTRGISFVDDVVEPFLKIPPAGKDKYRIVYIDEADYLTDASFSSFRGIIEKYHIKYGRFIFTCNYFSKIPEAIISRFTIYHFKQLPVDFVMDYCKSICDKEKVEYVDGDLRFLIEGLYPDVRRIVGTLQQSISNNKFKISKDIAQTSEKSVISSVIEICQALKNNESQKINKNISIVVSLLDKQDLDYRSIYLRLFDEKQIPIPAKIIINKYSNSHQNCLIPSMHFSACIFDIIKCLGDYYQAIKR